MTTPVKAGGGDLATALRAGILFKSKTGRAPRRRDFRPPDKAKWEKLLGLDLPTADTCARLFGSWSEYVSSLGYEPKKKLSNELIEESALGKIQELYPSFVAVQAHNNAYDGEVDGDRAEVKGSTLSHRRDHPDTLYFAFRTHSRELDKSCDRLLCVGLGWDDETQNHVPLVVLDFPRSALGLVSGKSVVMVYATSLFFGGYSLYSPYVVWKADVTPARLKELVRQSETP